MMKKLWFRFEAFIAPAMLVFLVAFPWIFVATIIIGVLNLGHQWVSFGNPWVIVYMIWFVLSSAFCGLFYHTLANNS